MRTCSIEKYVAKRIDNNQFLDYTILNGHAHAIWTPELRRATTAQTPQDLEEFLGLCGVNTNLVKIQPVVILLKTD